MSLEDLVMEIQTEEDYEAALKIVSALVDMDPVPGTPDGERLAVFGAAVVAWEAREYPIEGPDQAETD